MEGFDPNWYASIAGIVVATLAVVQGLKGMLANVEAANKIPIQLYVIAVSLILTTFANKGLGTLEGDLLKLCVDAVGAALASSGLFSWIQSGARPLGSTKAALDRTVPMLVVAVLAGAGLSACASGGPIQQTQSVASRAVTFQQLAAQAQDIVIAANKSGLVSTDDTAKAQVVFRRMGEEFQRLGELLKIIDQAGVTESSASTIRERLAIVREAMRQVLVLAGASRPTVEQLVILFDNVDRIFAEVEKALGAGRQADGRSAGWQLASA